MKQVKSIITLLNNYKLLNDELEQKTIFLDEEEKLLLEFKTFLRKMRANNEDKEKIRNQILNLKKLIMILKQETLRINVELNIIKSTIYLLQEPHFTILNSRYIQGKSIKAIAKIQNYSYQRVYQLHDEGVKKILDIIEKFNIE